MAMTQQITINQEQLELLLNSKMGSVLQAFKDPKHPSAAAKELSLSANKLHYYVRKLAASGLLVPVGKKARSTLYQAVAHQFLIPKSLMAFVEAGMPDVLEGIFGKLQAALQSEIIRCTNETLNSPTFDGREHYFSLDREPETLKSDFEPFIRIHGLKLDSGRYQELSQALLKTLESFSESQQGHVFTFTLIAFRGEVKDL
jgi:hypothetical protein